MRLRSINPAITNEKNPERLNARLDPFDAKNGYNPNGSSNYSDVFKSRYFKAQAERMNRLIDDAQELLKKIEAGQHIYTDELPSIFRVSMVRGCCLSTRASGTRRFFPEKLLKNDGSIVIQFVESIAPPRPELKDANQTFSEGSREGLTVRSFLSSNAIRATNSMDELQIDLCSSNNSTPCMLQSVTVPLLAAANQASFQNLIQEIEINYLYARSEDKDFIVVEGATTGVTPARTARCPLQRIRMLLRIFSITQQNGSTTGFPEICSHVLPARLGREPSPFSPHTTQSTLARAISLDRQN